MKSTMKKIGKVILIYIICEFLFNIICILFLRQFYNGKSYFEIILFLFGQGDIIEQNNFVDGGVIAFVLLIKEIFLAILVSWIFALIANREARIVFQEKIVIRRRTSEENVGKLTLGILVGNPNKKFLYDIECSVNCTYLERADRKNGETVLYDKIDCIKDYYRFSFEFKSLPKKFWQHYLEKKEEYLDIDVIRVTITEKANELGGHHRIIKEYGIQDIIVDNHDPEKKFIKKKKNIFTSKEKKTIDWAEFSKCYEAAEDERENIINEIKEYVNKA